MNLLQFLPVLVSDIIEAITRIAQGLDKAINSTPSSLTFAGSLAKVVNDWQTLIAGGVAFLPAFFAAIFVWRQVHDQRKQFHKVEEAKALKARLRLSGNVSQLSGHFDACYSALLVGDFDEEVHFVPSKLLDDVLEAGILSSEENFSFFQKYIENVQIYGSFCRLQKDTPREDQLVKCYAYLATCDILTDRLYPFARFEAEKLDGSNVTAEQIRQYLLHNLRRGHNIDGTSLDELMKLQRFGEIPKV